MNETITADLASDGDDAPKVIVEHETHEAPEDDAAYGERVRKRLAKERRKQGDLERQLAAERAARVDLEQRLRASDHTAIGYAEAAVGQRVTAIKSAIAAAYAAGDAVKLAELQGELGQATADLRQVEQVKAQRPAQAAPAKQGAFTPATQAWITKNPWFVSNADMREAAIRIHNTIATRLTPDTPAYFSEIERRVRGAFPDHFDDGDGDSEGMEDEEAPPARKPAIAAGQARTVAGREPVSPTRVKLSAEEVDIAKALGMTPERYAQRKLALSNNGELGKYKRQ